MGNLLPAGNWGGTDSSSVCVYMQGYLLDLLSQSLVSFLGFAISFLVHIGIALLFLARREISVLLFLSWAFLWIYALAHPFTWVAYRARVLISAASKPERGVGGKAGYTCVFIAGASPPGLLFQSTDRFFEATSCNFSRHMCIFGVFFPRPGGTCIRVYQSFSSGFSMRTPLLPEFPQR